MKDPMQKRKRRWPKVVLIVLLTLGILCAWGLYQGLTVRHYSVHSPKLPLERLRIALITDLHNYLYGENQAELLRLIEREKPDLILLGGDIADTWAYPMEGTQKLVEGIVTIAPCYYVTGNHEFWSLDVPALKEALRQAGVTVLEGDTVPILWYGIILELSGLDDPDGAPYMDRRGLYRAELLEFANLDRDTFRVLLAHRPEYIEDYAKLPFDLVLCGHTHGGQVRIPLLLNGLYAPDQGNFPKYAGGEYRVGETTMIISRGLAYYPHLPRIFNPPELVIVDLSR